MDKILCKELFHNGEKTPLGFHVALSHCYGRSSHYSVYKFLIDDILIFLGVLCFQITHNQILRKKTISMLGILEV